MAEVHDGSCVSVRLPRDSPDPLCRLKIVDAGAGIPELLVGRASTGRLLLRRTDVGPTTRISLAGFGAPSTS